MAKKPAGELAVRKVVKSQATDDGKWAVLWIEDIQDRSIGISIPAEQGHSAALAIVAATDAAYAKKGTEDRPIFKTAKIGFGPHPQSPDRLFVQVLYPRNGGSLAFEYDGAAARLLHAELHKFLYGDAPHQGAPPVRH